VIDIYQELKNFDIQVDVYDPWANPEEVMHEYGVTVVNISPTAESRVVSLELRDSLPTPHSPLNFKYSAAVLAVAHKEFSNLNIRDLVGNGVVFDVKGVLPKDQVDARL
jgi:UDP-N-acetyl-D-galactosamine dehydrogenase